VPGESFDMDEVFERILIDHDGKSSVYSMGKVGILWELDRKTGKFVRATDLGYQTLLDVDPTTGRATYRPGLIETQNTGKEVFFCPSTGGVKGLRAMAYHPDTRALYVPLNIHCVTSLWPTTPGPGIGWKVQQYHFHDKTEQQLGELQALDVATGKALWKKRRRAPYNTSTLTTGGGLLFVGTWDRQVYALDAKSGAELWQSGLPTLANGSPITYSAGGKQYVAFGSGASIGGSTWVDLAPAALLPDLRNPRSGNRTAEYGNGLFVFALPDE